MFALAERLHMTVAELGVRMSSAEFVEWQAFDTWRQREEKRARWRADAKSKLSGGKGRRR